MIKLTGNKVSLGDYKFELLLKLVKDGETVGYRFFTDLEMYHLDLTKEQYDALIADGTLVVGKDSVIGQYNNANVVLRVNSEDCPQEEVTIKDGVFYTEDDLELLDDKIHRLARRFGDYEFVSITSCTEDNYNNLWKAVEFIDTVEVDGVVIKSVNISDACDTTFNTSFVVDFDSEDTTSKDFVKALNEKLKAWGNVYFVLDDSSYYGDKCYNLYGMLYYDKTVNSL